MSIGGRIIALFVCFSFFVTPVVAQDVHVVDPSAIDDALRERVADEDAQRERVLHVLEKAEVQRVARTMAFDLASAEDAVATLDGAELAELASLAEDVESELAGGNTITISTTTIIIALLVLILIIVAT